MISFLVDQNFNEIIVDGLTRRNVDLDFVHVRHVGLAAATDPEVLDWAATADRVLLTHDRNTIPPFAHDRVATGKSMPGVFLVDDRMSVSQAIDEILLAALCLTPDECQNLVKYFPL